MASALNNQPSWNSVPAEILAQILRYLPARERYRAAATCKQWRYVCNMPRVWTSLSICPEEDITKEEIDFYLRNIKHLQNLELILSKNPSKYSHINFMFFVNEMSRVKPKIKSIFVHGFNRQIDYRHEEDYGPRYVDQLTDLFGSELETITIAAIPNESMTGQDRYRFRCLEQRNIPKLQELHDPTFRWKEITQLHSLHTLSVNWTYVVLERQFAWALGSRPDSAVRLRKLNIHVRESSARPRSKYEMYGSCADRTIWDRLHEKNPGLKVCIIQTMVLDNRMTGLYELLGRVYMWKIFCPPSHRFVQQRELQRLARCHRDTLQVLACVNMDWLDISYLFKEPLGGLRCLTLLGRQHINASFLRNLRFGAPKLEHLAINSCAIRDEEANGFMTPDAIAELEKDVSSSLGKPWKLLNAPPPRMTDFRFYEDGSNDDDFINGVELPPMSLKFDDSEAEQSRAIIIDGLAEDSDSEDDS